MYDEYLIANTEPQPTVSSDLDSLIDNLTNDITSFNQYISDINKQKKVNSISEKELEEEKIRVEKAKIEFENYVRVKNEEISKKEAQIEEYLNIQKQNLSKAELDFKMNMDNSLNELEIVKNEVELQRSRYIEEKQQFETYKNIELNRIKHAQEMLDSEKTQFEKYKEVTNRKIELENKNIEQKCDRFKALINNFNSNFKPMVKEEE